MQKNTINVNEILGILRGAVMSERKQRRVVDLSNKISTNTIRKYPVP